MDNFRSRTPPFFSINSIFLSPLKFPFLILLLKFFFSYFIRGILLRDYSTRLISKTSLIILFFFFFWINLMVMILFLTILHRCLPSDDDKWLIFLNFFDIDWSTNLDALISIKTWSKFSQRWERMQISALWCVRTLYQYDGQLLLLLLSWLRRRWFLL